MAYLGDETSFEAIDACQGPFMGGCNSLELPEEARLQVSVVAGDPG